MKITGDLTSHSFLHRRQVMNAERLGLIGRLLLTSDGTVTVMLEQIVGEKIVTARLDQSMAPVDQETAALMSFSVTGLLTRTTNLTGAATVRSMCGPRPCSAQVPVRSDLLGTDEPIGRVLRRHRVECFLK